MDNTIRLFNVSDLDIRNVFVIIRSSKFESEMRKNAKILKLFGERYRLIEYEDGYLLYDKEGKSTRSNGEYLGKFTILDGEYVFEGERYGGVEELVCGMRGYNARLPFSAEVYNPMYRKHCMVEMALHYYLESVGFEHKPMDRYCLIDGYGQCLCEVYFEVKEDTTTGIVGRMIPGTDRWTESEFEDLDSAIGSVNSILASYLVMVNAITVGVLGKLTESRASEVYNKRFDMKSLKVYSEDARKKTIELLKEELKRLENK